MPRSSFSHLKNKALDLRVKGKTYSEINNSLTIAVPKSTLSLWFKDLKLTKKSSRRLKFNQKTRIKLGQINALKINKENRKIHLEDLFEENKHLAGLLENNDIAKIALIILYLGEGSKNPKRSLLTFGNSDPKIVKLFLKLFRKCFKVDESKFRCTVQCRADQNTSELEKFWHSITKIPLQSFYKTRIDPRSIGQKSRKPEYKGVCRIDYLSSGVLNDILKGIEVLTGL